MRNEDDIPAPPPLEREDSRHRPHIFNLNSLHVELAQEVEIVQAAAAKRSNILSMHITSLVEGDAIDAFCSALHYNLWPNLKYLYMGGFIGGVPEFVGALKSGACPNLKVLAVSCWTRGDMQLIVDTFLARTVCPKLRRLVLLDSRRGVQHVKELRELRPGLEFMIQEGPRDGLRQCFLYHLEYGTPEECDAFQDDYPDVFSRP